MKVVTVKDLRTNFQKVDEILLDFLKGYLFGSKQALRNRLVSNWSKNPDVYC
jgi:hypothetical protein